MLLATSRQWYYSWQPASGRWHPWHLKPTACITNTNRAVHTDNFKNSSISISHICIIAITTAFTIPVTTSSQLTYLVPTNRGNSCLVVAINSARGSSLLAPIWIQTVVE
jgi:hypothetical protein